MVRLSANSIRVVGDADASGVDVTPGENAGAPDHVGAWLREAREATGRDLHDVAAHLRIRYPYLLAIEEGRFDDLPGRAYAAGFIRSYATHLGLDGEAMVARFKADAEAIAGELNLKFPTPAPEGRFPGSTALLVSMILAAALVGGWYYYQDRGAIGLERVPAPPAAEAGQRPVPQATLPAADTAPVAIAPTPAEPEIAAPANADATNTDATNAAAPSPVASMPEPVMPPPPAAPVVTMAETSSTAPVAAPPSPAMPAMPAAPGTNDGANRAAALAPVTETPMAAAPAAVSATPRDSTTPAQPQHEQMAAAEPPAETLVTSDEPAPAEPQAAALPRVPAIAPAGAPEGRVYGLTNRDARIVIQARGDSWLQVLDADQREVFTNVLKAGESYRVPNREGLVMRVGTPNALVVSIDDEPGFQISDTDQPLTGILLDPDRLRDGTAVR